MLVYRASPSASKGVCIERLKWLRDGVEDYDYVQILKDSEKRNSRCRSRAPLDPIGPTGLATRVPLRLPPETRRSNRPNHEHIGLRDTPRREVKYGPVLLTVPACSISQPGRKGSGAYSGITSFLTRVDRVRVSQDTAIASNILVYWFASP